MGVGHIPLLMNLGRLLGRREYAYSSFCVSLVNFVGKRFIEGNA
jgi:hypothetical protein